MKYVFRISSHLTFFLSKKIIQVKNYDIDDCILFLVRDYHIPSEYDSLFKNQIHTSLNVSQSQGRIFEGLNVVKTYKNIRDFDHLVDDKIGEDPFIWFAQICNDDICSLMVTKKNCIGYYVIEDGLGSYRDSNPQTFCGWRYWVYKIFLKPCFPRIFAVKNKFIYTESPKFKGCIATNSHCFPLHTQFLETVGNPFDEQELPFAPDAILSIDPLYFFVDDNTVDLIYEDLSKIIMAKKYEQIYFKFHPYFFAESNAEMKIKYGKKIKHFFGDKVNQLSSDIVLECVLSKYKCDFYTNNSSISIYASQMGAKCYSYSPIVKKHDPSYKEEKIVYNYCQPLSIE